MPTHEWGILIVNYLFLGGLSAGLFFVAALAGYLEKDGESRYQQIARIGAWLAPWPVAAGSLLLIFDLGNWYRFYKLFLHFRWQSPMSIGSWLLVLFHLVALAYCWSWLPPAFRTAILKTCRLPRPFDRDPAPWRKLIAAAGFPLSIGVGIYTGVLLGAVQARPFWNTNLVAQMFLFSALSTGCAVLILLRSFGPRRLDPAEVRFLYSLDVTVMALEFFIVVPYLIHGELSVDAVRQSLQLILGGPYTLAFWALFMGAGLLAPLAAEIWELAPAVISGRQLHHRRRLAAVACGLVLVGGYVLRYVFVFAGQMSSFR
jgi:formate-dependent nitrite reductase membrane component NrfD